MLVEVCLEFSDCPEIALIFDDAIHVVTVGLKTGLTPQVPLFMLSALLLLRSMNQSKVLRGLF
jgi:hypothetical protein